MNDPNNFLFAQKQLNLFDLDVVSKVFFFLLVSAAKQVRNKGKLYNYDTQ